jgi:nicotinamide mononucleotide adenylyltransferase
MRYTIEPDGYGDSALWEWTDETDTSPQPILYMYKTNPTVWEAATRALAPDWTERSETDMWVERLKRAEKAVYEAADRLGREASVNVAAARRLARERGYETDYFTQSLESHVDAYDEAKRTHWAILMNQDIE